MSDADPLRQYEGFDWHDGNIDKNWKKHGISFWECEEIFLNEPLVVKEDAKHSLREDRYYALGKTNFGRLLFVAFTVRRNLIRVISTRDMTRKEKKTYEQYEEKDSDV